MGPVPGNLGEEIVLATVSLAGLSGSSGHAWLDSRPRAWHGLGHPVGHTGELGYGRMCGKKGRGRGMSSDGIKMQRKGLDTVSKL